MKGLFYVSGILLALAIKMLAWGVQHKKRSEAVIGFCMMTISLAYAVFYFVHFN
jgi:hypothetical protein